MEYRVEALAAQAAVKVDTIRFYQGRGLLPAPRRVGRAAVYGDSHLERLLRIRRLLAGGFTLAQIRKLLDADSSGGEGYGPARVGLCARSTVRSFNYLLDKVPPGF